MADTEAFVRSLVLGPTSCPAPSVLASQSLVAPARIPSPGPRDVEAHGLTALDPKPAMARVLGATNSMAVAFQSNLPPPSAIKRKARDSPETKCTKPTKKDKLQQPTSLELEQLRQCLSKLKGGYLANGIYLTALERQHYAREKKIAETGSIRDLGQLNLSNRESRDLPYIFKNVLFPDQQANMQHPGCTAAFATPNVDALVLVRSPQFGQGAFDVPDFAAFAAWPSPVVWESSHPGSSRPVQGGTAPHHSFPGLSPLFGAPKATSTLDEAAMPTASVEGSVVVDTRKRPGFPRPERRA
jgi:hypothetical protein